METVDTRTPSWHVILKQCYELQVIMALRDKTYNVPHEKLQK
jgi:hypothetical protein